MREPAARTVTRTAVGSSREAQENRDDRNNRAETTENNRVADQSRSVRSAPRGGRGAVFHSGKRAPSRSAPQELAARRW